MLDIKKWERADIVYAILSMAISIVLVSVVLIQHTGLFAKTILFIVISVLIYFVLKYIQEYKSKSTEKSVYKQSSKVSIKTSNKEKIVEDLESDKKKSEEEEESNIEHFDRMSSEHRPIKMDMSGQHHPLGHSISKLGNEEVDHHPNNSIYRDTKQDFLLSEEEEEEQPPPPHPHHEEEEEEQPPHPHHEEEEEEQPPSPHPHHEEEEEEHPPPHSKSVHLTPSKIGETPININISYNTRNSTNTDDVVNIRERFGKPDQSDHIFNTPAPPAPPPPPAPETINMKMNTNVQNKVKSNNQLLSQNNSNNKYYKPPDSKCHGSACSPQPPRKDKVYSGHNYEYMNPDIPFNNFENCMGNRKNKEVCPVSINQNWSKWDPQYLTGDDSNSNMVN